MYVLTMRYKHQPYVYTYEFIILLCAYVCRIGHTGNLPRKSPRIYHPHFKNPENEGEAGSSYCTIKILQLEDDIKRQQNEIEGLRIHNESLRNKVKELNSLLDQ